MIEYRADGSVLLGSEPDQKVTLVIPKGKTKEQQDAAILQFFTDNPCPEPPNTGEKVEAALALLGITKEDLKEALA